MVLGRRAASSASTPRRIVVVGDIGADVEAARAAGAAGVLVPTAGDPARGGRGRSGRAANLTEAVDGLLAGGARTVSRVRRVLVARLDSAGDVLLAGPAVRAVAAGGRRSSCSCGPAGAAAAALLPGVDEVLDLGLPLDRSATRRRSTPPTSTGSSSRLRRWRLDEAVV